MSGPFEKPNAKKLPTRSEALLFAAKVWGLRTHRWMADLHANVRLWPRELKGSGKWFSHFESRSGLWVEYEPAEQALERGKVENLRLACERMDGVVIDADGVFSFWRQLGRAGKRQGFVEGRMLQQGCLLPAIGGGLCQLSNALYELALLSGCEILERHAHSARLPHMPFHDATVAWNYVDLRFRVRERTRLRAVMEERQLVVAFEEERPSALRPLRLQASLQASATQASPAGGINAQSCASCGETSCFRHRSAAD